MTERFVFVHVPDPERRRYLVIDTTEPSPFGGQQPKAVTIAECLSDGHAERIARVMNAHPDLYDERLPNPWEFVGGDAETGDIA